MIEKKPQPNREVQHLGKLHEFDAGNDEVVLVEAPSLLQALKAWAAVIDEQDLDELSNSHIGSRYLVICDQEVDIPRDRTVNLTELGYSIVDEPGRLVAYKGATPEGCQTYGYGVMVYRAK